MNTRKLREFMAEIGDLRDRLHEGGDQSGTERLDEILERLRELADHSDAVLSRLGNPRSER